MVYNVCDEKHVCVFRWPVLDSTNECYIFDRVYGKNLLVKNFIARLNIMII